MLRRPARRLGRGPARSDAIWITLVMWMCDPLQALLSGVDPAAPLAAQSATSLYRDAHYAAALYPLWVLAVRRERAWRLARAAWPLLGFLAWGAVSAFWAPDRAFALQSLPMQAATAATAAGLAVARRPAPAARILAAALGWNAMLSVLAALALPHWGVANPHDYLGASAAGDWRGLFVHKNVLGHVSGIAFAILLTGRRLFQGGAFRWAGVAASGTCVLAARSASGVVLALLLVAFQFARSSLRGRARSAALAFACAGGALAGGFWTAVASTALAALHRDPSLSGRAGIWHFAWELSAAHALAGRGFNASAAPDVASQLTARFGVDHLHNAMLDVWLNLGAVGVGLLALATAGALWAVRRSRPGSIPRTTLVLLLVGWLVSGVTEDMGVRPQGALAELGLCSLFALYGVAARRRSFRRPVFGFSGPWPAPLRPPRLRSPA